MKTRQHFLRVPRPADRFREVLETVFAGSQSAMALKLGCSQSYLSRIVNTKKHPGPKLLMALANCPGVNRSWALTGKGDAGTATTAHDAMLPVSNRPLPGEVEEFRGYLCGTYLPVIRTYYSPSRYWLMISSADLIIPGVEVGDALLVETDGSWRANPRLIQDNFCVVLESKNPAPRLYRLKYRHESQDLAILTRSGEATGAGQPTDLAPAATKPPPRRNLLLRRDQYEESAAAETRQIETQQAVSPKEPSESIVEQKMTVPAKREAAREIAENTGQFLALEAVVGVAVLQQRLRPWR